MIRALRRIWRAWGHEYCKQLRFELLKMFCRKRTHIGFAVFTLGFVARATRMFETSTGIVHGMTPEMQRLGTLPTAANRPESSLGQ